MNPKKRILSPSVFLLLAAFLLPGRSAWPGGPGPDVGEEKTSRIKWFPGPSRAISHSLSASPDTALFTYEVSPYGILAGGGDSAFFRADFESLSLRPGLFGMAEMHSSESFDFSGDSELGVPGPGTKLVRGLLGPSLAVSWERLAADLLGPGGILESAISFRHESEHFTGSRWDTEPVFPFVPHVGDFIILDAAVRIPIRSLDLEARLQNKFFFFPHLPAYTFGPGADLIIRWRLRPFFHPFSSTFFEYLFGHRAEYDPFPGICFRVPDKYYFRNLTGIILSYAGNEVLLFNSLRVGHGLGLLGFREEFTWGGGIRFILF